MNFQYVKMLLLWLLLGGTVFAYTEPPLLTVTKPTPNTTVTIDGGGTGDYLTFTAAIADYANLTPPVLYYIKQGTYSEMPLFDMEPTTGNECVFAPHPDNTANVKIVHTGTSYTHTIMFSGENIIIDGGEGNTIEIDGNAATSASHRNVRIGTTSANITLYRMDIHCFGTSTSSTNVTIEYGGDYTKIYNCTIRDSLAAGIYVNDGDNTQLRNNIIYNNAGAGIQVNPHVGDDTVDELTISGNVVYDNATVTAYSGIVLTSEGSPPALYTVYVYNNLVFGNGGNGINISTPDNTDAYVYNNTVYNNGTYGFRFPSSDTVNATAYMSNNISYGSGISNWQSSVTEYSTFDCTTYCDNNLITDPSFTSITSTDADFLKLSVSSTNAIEQGTDLSTTFTTDYGGDTRTVPWDIGAWLYTAPTTAKTIGMNQTGIRKY